MSPTRSTNNVDNMRNIHEAMILNIEILAVEMLHMSIAYIKSFKATTEKVLSF